MILRHKVLPRSAVDMKIFVIVLALTATGAFCRVGMQGDVGTDGSENEVPASEGSETGESKREAPESDDGGFQYNFAVNRVENAIAPGYPIVYMYYQVQPQQNITYFENVDGDHPLMVELIVYNSYTDQYFYATNDNNFLNACDQYESGTWDDVLIRIIDTGLMPDAKCPVEAGNYIVSQSFEIPAKLNEQLNCGHYQLYANLYAHEVWALQVAFHWTVLDNCVH